MLKDIKVTSFIIVVLMISSNARCASFQDNGNGTVTDFSTGLVWQQSDSQNEFARSQSLAGPYCAVLVLAGETDWRLPQVKELTTLSDSRRFNPAIDLLKFPQAISGAYWTSSSLAGSFVNDWVVRFDFFSVSPRDVSQTAYVRCVRQQ